MLVHQGAPRSPSDYLTTLQRLFALDETDLPATSEHAAKLIRAALGADHAAVCFRDEATEALDAPGIDGPVGEVFRSGRPYVSGHVNGNGSGAGSEMIAPICVDGVARGVLVARTAAPGVFDTTDLAFLVAVARWIGLTTHLSELTAELARLAAVR